MVSHTEAIYEKLDEIQAYRGTDLFSHFVDLLGMIDHEYDDEFRSVSAEKLPFKQGASQQVRRLRDVLIDPERGDLPKV